MIESYLTHEQERKELGIPALPLTVEQTESLCELLQNPPAGKEEFLKTLLIERVAPGVDPSAEVKAAFLDAIVKGEKSSPIVTKSEAITILGLMVGGYNVQPLIDALSNAECADEAATTLSGITLVYDSFDDVLALSKTNAAAKTVIDSWANGEWFTSREELAETMTLKVYKVDAKSILMIFLLLLMLQLVLIFHFTLSQWVKLFSQMETKLLQNGAKRVAVLRLLVMLSVLVHHVNRRRIQFFGQLVKIFPVFQTNVAKVL